MDTSIVDTPISQACIDGIEAKHLDAVRKWMRTHAEEAKDTLMKQLKTNDNRLVVCIPIDEDVLVSLERMLLYRSQPRKDRLIQMVRSIIIDHSVEEIRIGRHLEAPALIIKFNLDS
jgi:hypothetical protein